MRTKPAGRTIVIMTDRPLESRYLGRIYFTVVDLDTRRATRRREAKNRRETLVPLSLCKHGTGYERLRAATNGNQASSGRCNLGNSPEAGLSGRSM